MELLLHQLQAHPQVTLQWGRPAAGAGSTPAAGPAADPAVDLVVGADGSQSPSRQAAGLAWFERTYGQACLTVQVRLRGGRPDQAWELLRPEGPFAVLPLGGDAFQLVWSAPARRLRRLESLDGAAFLDQLAGALPDQLQPEALLDQPRAYPVALALAWPLAKAPLVLVGDSAHRCHPVGGQGLNLGWRDVDCLQRLAARVSSGHLAPERLAAAYRWRRWPDLLATLRGTAESRYIFYSEIAIRTMKLPESVVSAIQHKLSEEQRAAAYDFRLTSQRQEAERLRIEAIGLRNFYSIVQGALTDKLLTWRGIEATVQVARSPNSKIVIVGGNKDQLPLILGSDEVVPYVEIKAF